MYKLFLIIKGEEHLIGNFSTPNLFANEFVRSQGMYNFKFLPNFNYSIDTIDGGTATIVARKD